MGVRRRPPDVPDAVLLARWVPSPSAAGTAPNAPPHPGAVSRQRTCRPPPPWQGGKAGSARTVPTFTTCRSTGPAPSSSPCGIATRMPPAFPVASTPAARLGRHRSRRRLSLLSGLIRHVRACVTLEWFNHWFTRVAPLRLAERTRDRLAVPARSALVGAAPTRARASGFGLPQLHLNRYGRTPSPRYTSNLGSRDPPLSGDLEFGCVSPPTVGLRLRGHRVSSSTWPTQPVTTVEQRCIKASFPTAKASGIDVRAPTDSARLFASRGFPVRDGKDARPTIDGCAQLHQGEFGSGEGSAHHTSSRCALIARRRAPTV